MKRQRMQAAMSTGTNRRKMQIQNMRYRRFMMLRYCLAIFFFMNLSWLVMQYAQPNLMIALPVGLMALNVLALINVQRQASRQTTAAKPRLNGVRWSLWAQVLVAMGWGFTLLFMPAWRTVWIPLFEQTPAVVGVMSGLLFLLIGYALLGIGKVQRMEQKKDRWYQSVKQFEQQLGGS